MKYFQSSPAARFFFFFVSANIWFGVWLSGMSVVHWWLYIPAAFLLIAAVTGFCPGMLISRWMFKDT